MLLNFPLIDWITITSFDEQTHHDAMVMFDQLIGFSGGAYKLANRLQYQGRLINGGNGHAFLGFAEQKNVDHMMIQVSGELAHMLLGLPMRSGDEPGKSALRKIALDPFSKVTRLDIQVTVRQPDDWSQYKFFKRVKETGKPCSFIESDSALDGGKLSTVYTGTRKSDNFVRTYQKDDYDGNLYIRHELELKGARSDAAKGPALRKLQLAGILKHYLNKIEDPMLDAVLRPILNNPPYQVTVKRESNLAKREKWIRNTVLPALKRYLADPEADMSLALELAQVMRYTNPSNDG